MRLCFGEYYLLLVQRPDYHRRGGGGVSSSCLLHRKISPQKCFTALPLQGTPLSCDRVPGRRSKTSFPWAGMLRPFWAKRVLMRR